MHSQNHYLSPSQVTELELAGSIDENDSFTPDYWIRQLPDQNIFFTDQHRNIIEKVMLVCMTPIFYLSIYVYYTYLLLVSLVYKYLCLFHLFITVIFGIYILHIFHTRVLDSYLLTFNLQAYGKFVENGAKINKTICREFKVCIYIYIIIIDYFHI